MCALMGDILSWPANLVCRGQVEVHPEWSPSMFAWMCDTTLVFRRSTPDANHTSPAPRNPDGMAVAKKSVSACNGCAVWP